MLVFFVFAALAPRGMREMRDLLCFSVRRVLVVWCEWSGLPSRTGQAREGQACQLDIVATANSFPGPVESARKRVRRQRNRQPRTLDKSAGDFDRPLRPSDKDCGVTSASVASEGIAGDQTLEIGI